MKRAAAKKRWHWRYVPAKRRAEKIPAEFIIATVAAHYGVTLAQFRGPRRMREISWPRQVAMTMCCEFTALSLPAIAARFGGRDHTTVVCGSRNVHERSRIFQRVSLEVAIVRAKLFDLAPFVPCAVEGHALFELARAFPPFPTQAAATGAGYAPWYRAWRASLPPAPSAIAPVAAV